MGIKKLIINSGIVACHLFAQLSKVTTTTSIIGRSPITNYFEYIPYLFFRQDNKITLVGKIRKE